MATYTELFDLHNNSDLINKVTIAIVVAAETIVNEDPGTVNHANRLLWAAEALLNPKAVSPQMYWAVLAGNADEDVATILAATDAQIQTQVNNHVDLFATG